MDLVAVTARPTSAEKVNAAFKAAGHPRYTEDPVVSSDILHNPNSFIVNAQMTKVLDGNPVNVVDWSTESRAIPAVSWI